MAFGLLLKGYGRPAAGYSQRKSVNKTYVRKREHFSIASDAGNAKGARSVRPWL
jgi:hypothetical protein